VSLAWLLHQPAVTAPVVGATRVRHIEDAVAATTVSLSAAEIALLEAKYVPHEVQPKR
jgi:aryl-alcohol dehydrogenase-like predicted oxidoreductase